VEIIRHCWTGEPFSFHGEYHRLENLRITPKPYQDPAPPLWIGASTPPGARRAGRMADGFVATPSVDLATTLELADIYREAAAREGRDPVVVMMRDAWVAETRAEAEEVYGPEVIEAYKYYWRNGLPDFRGIHSENEITLDNIGPDRLILGDPEECVAEFQRWNEAVGAEYFLLRLRHAHSGGPPHERIMDAIRLFGEEVIPACS